MKNLIKNSAILLALSFSVTVYGGEHTHSEHLNEITGVESLSPELLKLLSQEMKAIQQGMASILPELASGNLEKVAKIAKQIENSYIIKQSLTKEQAKELHNKLPAYFIELDKSFHKDAGKLAHVAEAKDTELANFYFFKLNNACISCHSNFATHKFSSFKVEKNNYHKH